MNERANWTFKVNYIDLLSAVQDKLSFHEERRKWWTDKREEVTKALKEAGVKITESLVVQYAQASSVNNRVGGSRSRGGMSVELDEDLQEDLAECTQKIEHHTNLLQTFQNWNNLLTQTDHTSTSFQLAFDDYVFFFGK